MVDSASSLANSQQRIMKLNHRERIPPAIRQQILSQLLSSFAELEIGSRATALWSDGVLVRWVNLDAAAAETQRLISAWRLARRVF